MEEGSRMGVSQYRGPNGEPGEVDLSTGNFKN